MGPEVKFIMLPFIMFDYTPGLVLRNNSKPRKRFRAHHYCTKTNNEKGEFWTLVHFSSNRGKIEYASSGVLQLTENLETFTSH